MCQNICKEPLIQRSYHGFQSLPPTKNVTANAFLHLSFAHLCQYVYGANSREWHCQVPSYLHLKCWSLLPHCLLREIHQHTWRPWCLGMAKCHAQCWLPLGYLIRALSLTTSTLTTQGEKSLCWVSCDGPGPLVITRMDMFTQKDIHEVSHSRILCQMLGKQHRVCLKTTRSFCLSYLLEPDGVKTLIWVPWWQAVLGGADLGGSLHLPATAATLAGARVLECDTATVCERDLMLH